MSIDACGACMSTIGGVCDKHSKNSINKTMDKKQQFIEKSLNKILTSKFIIALALALPTEVYDDFIKEIAKVIHLQLSECWDMAKVKGAEELFVKLDEEYESFKISEAVGSVLTKYRNSILYEKNKNTDSE